MNEHLEPDRLVALADAWLSRNGTPRIGEWRELTGVRDITACLIHNGCVATLDGYTSMLCVYRPEKLVQFSGVQLE